MNPHLTATPSRIQKDAGPGDPEYTKNLLTRARSAGKPFAKLRAAQTQPQTMQATANLGTVKYSMPDGSTAHEAVANMAQT